MFQNRVFWLLEPNRDEVTREWRKLHNEEVNNLNSSPNIIQVSKIKKSEIGRACRTYGER